MPYYVVTPSGRYGPAELPQLAEWAREGRLGPSSILEEVGGKQTLAQNQPGLTFTTFQSPPTASSTVLPLPASSSIPSPMQPLPPVMVSNYRRPDWEPPLFLHDPTQGKRELVYAFVFALVAPIGAIFLFHALLLPFGGIYGGYIAWKRGRNLGVLAMILSSVSLLVSFAVYFFTSFR